MLHKWWCEGSVSSIIHPVVMEENVTPKPIHSRFIIYQAITIYIIIITQYRLPTTVWVQTSNFWLLSFNFQPFVETGPEEPPLTHSQSQPRSWYLHDYSHFFRRNGVTLGCVWADRLIIFFVGSAKYYIIILLWPCVGLLLDQRRVFTIKRKGSRLNKEKS